MREDFMEQVDKMFPEGVIVIYPKDDLKTLRMYYHIVKGREETQSDRQIKETVKLIENTF